jgi:predicted TIM-barrel fold metal-dependent hydrolase
MLRMPEHLPERARFPVIDAHNHLFGDLPAEELLAVMDGVGVRTFLNVSGNVALPFDPEGYTIETRDIGAFLDGYVRAHPGRFAAFTMSEFGRWGDFTILGPGFVERALAGLEAHVAAGACGLKITKELGLKFRDPGGATVPVDDERLFPIWRRAGQLGVPVLMHTSDPAAFFLPVDAGNEHYATLREFPRWSSHRSHFGKEQLLAQRDRVVARHPGTTFILPHVANHPEDLASVARLLEAHPNVFVDLSARIDELGRQPYTAREFLVAFRDRVLFGTDMPVSAEVYRCHFRFLETRDEWFEYPDYLGRWGRARWGICGLGLPDDVLRGIYHQNAARVIPGL